MLLTTKYERDLLEALEGDIVQVSADGVYDQHKCYKKASQLEAKTTFPPRKDAVIWHHGTCIKAPHLRDENLK